MIDSEREFFEGQAESWIKSLEQFIYPVTCPLEARCIELSQPGLSSGPPPDWDETSSRRIGEGDVWGESFAAAWFRLEGRVPEDWRGGEVVALLDFGSEACLFDQQGNPLQGLSNSSVFHPHTGRNRFELFPSCSGGEEVELWVEAVANELWGLTLNYDPAPEDPKRFGSYQARADKLRLAKFDREAWHLWIDAQILFELMRSLPENGVRRSRILRTLNRAAAGIYAGRGDLSGSRGLLKQEFSQEARATDLSTVAVGHAHIDTAWLWPIREGIRKCVRTFATQVALLEKYPEYIFGASQAQHYAFVKERHPILYNKIKALVAAGRWEVQGAMWVEADTNIPGGESLVRQILHGKNFFRDEFGIEVRNLWLPDVFGYSAALPQILKKSGIDFFLTQKLSWNQFNRFPFHTFFWQGIDGSRVLTHFPPEDTYNSTLSPTGLNYARENFEEKDRLEEFLTLFGIGDGGGGPLPEHIEKGLRQRDLLGCPRVMFGKAQEFFDRLSLRAEQSTAELHTWVGELYLELHRGTLTTQARTKRMNRLLELKLREVEFLHACAPLESYPVEELERAWQTVLLHQFHDIIPGSSIHQVYVDSDKAYREVEEELDRLKIAAGRNLLRPSANHLTLINTLSVPFRDAVVLPELWPGYEVLDAAGNPVPSQEEEDGTALLVDVPSLSSLTFKRGRFRGGAWEAGSVEQTRDLVLENELVCCRFSSQGTLESVYDKQLKKEFLVSPGSGNLLSLYHDKPLNWDAWDIDVNYEKQLIEHAELSAARWLADGPVRQVLLLQFSVGRSAISQKVVLRRGSRRIDFVTEVDWQERRKMLRVSFGVNVLSSVAGFDIQYGHVFRNTHRNTSWDMARFEVAGHRFADLSQGDCGVALLNNCKYGYKVWGNTLDLNLLRSPIYPDAEADRGKQFFTYSLLPHAGTLIESDVFAEAAMLNQGVSVFPGFDGGAVELPFSLTGEGVTVEVLKKAEREECLVLRAYEHRGCAAKAELVFREDVKVFETDLMEWEERFVKTPHGRLSLEFRPFEIRTFKLKR